MNFQKVECAIFENVDPTRIRIVDVQILNVLVPLDGWLGIAGGQTMNHHGTHFVDQNRPFGSDEEFRGDNCIDDNRCGDGALCVGCDARVVALVLNGDITKDQGAVDILYRVWKFVQGFLEMQNGIVIVYLNE